MKQLKLVSCLILIQGVFLSCGPLDINHDETLSGIDGIWMVDETSSLFKNTLGYYSVNIETSQTDSEKILIYNFYQLGTDVYVVGNIINSQIFIESQSVKGGYTISGSGLPMGDYKEIHWTYEVEDGGGEVDHVTAIYTNSF